MINIAIVDDEPIFIYTLINIIDNCCNSLGVKHLIDKFSNGYSVLENYNKYHLIFLDIEMPKINGFQFLELLGQFNFEVIFVTAYDAYVLNALRNDALDYLMKPVDPEELEAAINKLEEKVSKKANIQQNNKKENGRLSLATAEGIYYIKKSDML